MDHTPQSGKNHVNKNMLKIVTVEQLLYRTVLLAINTMSIGVQIWVLIPAVTGSET